jgi:hypothetical protein
MSLRKGASFRVFTDKTRVVAFKSQRAKCHMLGCSPVNLFLIKRLDFRINIHFAKSRVNVEASRDLNCCPSDLIKFGGIKSRLFRLFTELGKVHSLPLVCKTAAAPVSLAGCVAEFGLKSQASLILSFEVCVDLVTDFSNVFFGGDALRDQVLSVGCGLSSHGTNSLVHKRLSEAGLINFIVSVEPKADHVN